MVFVSTFRCQDWEGSSHTSFKYNNNVFYKRHNIQNITLQLFIMISVYIKGISTSKYYAGYKFVDFALDNIK